MPKADRVLSTPPVNTSPPFEMLEDAETVLIERGFRLAPNTCNWINADGVDAGVYPVEDADGVAKYRIEFRREAPPLDVTRRGFLSQAAGVTAGGATLALAIQTAPSAGSALRAFPASPDPVFKTIENHRQANASHWADLDAQNRLEEIGGPEAARFADAPCHADDAAFLALINTEPTTFAGFVALLAYLAEMAEDGGAWRFEDSEVVCVPLIANLASAVGKLAEVQS